MIVLYIIITTIGIAAIMSVGGNNTISMIIRAVGSLFAILGLLGIWKEKKKNN